MNFCQSCGAAFVGGAATCPACTPQAQPLPQANTGLNANTVGALTYLAGIITGILFLVIDPYKNDRFVRFHCFQSIFFNIAWTVLWIGWMIAGFVLGAVTKGLFFLLQVPIDILLMVGGFALWAFLMFSAYQGKTTRLPVIGALAAKQAGL